MQRQTVNSISKLHSISSGQLTVPATMIISWKNCCHLRPPAEAMTILERLKTEGSKKIQIIKRGNSRFCKRENYKLFQRYVDHIDRKTKAEPISGGSVTCRKAEKVLLSDLAFATAIYTIIYFAQWPNAKPLLNFLDL